MGVCSSTSSTPTQSVHAGSGIVSEKPSGRDSSSPRGSGSARGARPSSARGSRGAASGAATATTAAPTANNSGTRGVSRAAANAGADLDGDVGDAASAAEREGEDGSMKHSPRLGSAATRPPPTPILAGTGSRKTKKERPLANKYVAASTGAGASAGEERTPRGLALHTHAEGDAQLEAANLRALSLDTASGNGSARGDNAKFLRVTPSPRAAGVGSQSLPYSPKHGRTGSHGNISTQGHGQQRERDVNAYARRRSRRSSEGRRLMDEAAAGGSAAPAGGGGGPDPRRLTGGSGKFMDGLGTAGGAAGAMGLPRSTSPAQGTGRRRGTNPLRKSGVHHVHTPKRRTSNNGMMSRLALQFPLVRTSFLAVYRAFKRYMLVVQRAEAVVQERRRSQRNAAPLLLLRVDDSKLAQATAAAGPGMSKHGTPSASSRGGPTASTSATPAAGLGRSGADAVGCPLFLQEGCIDEHGHEQGQARGLQGHAHPAHGEGEIQMLDESGRVVGPAGLVSATSATAADPATARGGEGRALVDAVDAAMATAAASGGDGTRAGKNGVEDGHDCDDDDADMLSEEELRAREIAALLAASPTPLLLVPASENGAVMMHPPALVLPGDAASAAAAAGSGSSGSVIGGTDYAHDAFSPTASSGGAAGAAAGTVAPHRGLSNGASFTLVSGGGAAAGGVGAPASPQSHSASMASVALSLPSVSARRVRQLGTLTASRLGAALQAVTGSDAPLPEAELLRLFQLADLDHSASISFREFLVAVALGCFLREDIERDQARKVREAMAAAAGMPLPPPSPQAQTKPPSPQPSPQPQQQQQQQQQQPPQQQQPQQQQTPAQVQAPTQSQVQPLLQPGLLRPISRGAGAGVINGGIPPRSPVLPPTHVRGRSTSMQLAAPLPPALPPSPRRLELLDPIVGGGAGGGSSSSAATTATTTTTEPSGSIVAPTPLPATGGAAAASAAGGVLASHPSAAAPSPSHARGASISRGHSLGVPPRTPQHSSSGAPPVQSHFAEVARGFRVVYHAFREMDEDGSGSVDSTELKRALFSAAPMRSDEALLERRFAELDFDASGEIELAEFLYGVVAWVGLMDEDDQLEED